MLTMALMRRTTSTMPSRATAIVTSSRPLLRSGSSAKIITPTQTIWITARIYNCDQQHHQHHDQFDTANDESAFSEGGTPTEEAVDLAHDAFSCRSESSNK